MRRASEAAGLISATAVAVAGAALALAAFDSGPNNATGGGKPAQRESSVAHSPPPSPARSRKLVWSDEFNAPAGTLPRRANWSFQQGGQWGGGRELQCYTDRRENAAHDGRGSLVITVRRERYPCFDNPDSAYTSARIRSQDKREFQFGYIEARIKIPRGRGLWPAFWTVGNIGVWPEEGEFGIMEAVGSRPAAVYQAVHGATLTGGHWQQREVTTGPAWSNRFHRYGVLWEPRKVAFYVDGRSTSVRTAAEIPAGAVWPFNSFAHYLILNVAVGGWAPSPGRTTRFPQAMRIDYVRVYQ